MPLNPKQVELAVLLHAVEFHPRHQSASELIGELSGGRDEEGEQLRNAISALTEFGLLRENGNVIEPTPCALRATSILTL
jgi:hypothetical protein